MSNSIIKAEAAFNTGTTAKPFTLRVSSINRQEPRPATPEETHDVIAITRQVAPHLQGVHLTPEDMAYHAMRNPGLSFAHSGVDPTYVRAFGWLRPLPPEVKPRLWRPKVQAEFVLWQFGVTTESEVAAMPDRYGSRYFAAAAAVMYCASKSLPEDAIVYAPDYPGETRGEHFLRNHAGLEAVPDMPPWGAGEAFLAARAGIICQTLVDHPDYGFLRQPLPPSGE